MNKDRKIYSLHPIYRLFICPLFLILSIPVFVLVAWMSYHNIEDIEGTEVVLMCGIIWVWYIFFRTGYKVEILSENEVVFYTIFRKRMVDPKDVLWIKQGMLFVTIKLIKGEVALTTLMDNISSIKACLIEGNPNIVNSTKKAEEVEEWFKHGK